LGKGTYREEREVTAPSRGQGGEKGVIGELKKADAKERL